MAFKHVFDPQFKYRSADMTDVRLTFQRIRREQRNQSALPPWRPKARSLLGSAFQAEEHSSRKARTPRVYRNGAKRRATPSRSLTGKRALTWSMVTRCAALIRACTRPSMRAPNSTL